MRDMNRGVEFQPLIDPDEEHSPEDSGLLIPTGLTRRRKLGKQLLAYHTGDPELFLSAEQETALAKTIQDGLVAKETLEKVPAAEQMRYPAQTARLKAAIQIGIEAEHKLVECNMRYATILALTSMNITPGKASQGSTADKIIHHFADVRSLKSPDASLEDRIQIALEGMAAAAKKFKPKVDKRKKPIKFLSLASWQAQAALFRRIPETETRGVRLPSNIREELSKAKEDPDTFPPEKLDRLALAYTMTDSIAYEELDLSAHASEEYEDDYTGTPSLSPDEVIADQNETVDMEREVHLSLLRDEIQKVLSTLSEREAGVIRLRFGLVDGVPRNLDEIGAVYGVTRERIRQIESKTMSKLRNPDRSKYLEAYLDGYTSMQEHTYASPSHLPDRIHGVANLRQGVPENHKPLATLGEDRNPHPTTSSGLESWQATPEDTWETPVRFVPQSNPEAEMAAEEQFVAILRYADPTDFRRAPGEPVSYPTETYAAIQEACGKNLRPHHIESYWNEELSELTKTLKKALGKEFDLSRVSLLFSALLEETMRDEDIVELDIPEALDGKLDFFGTRLKHGIVVVNGNLGNFAGYQMEDLAQLHIKGSAGDYAAAYSSGLASLEIEGDAGKEFAHGATGEPSFTVKGTIKSLGSAPRFDGELIAGTLKAPNLASKHAKGHIILGGDSQASS